MVSQHTLPQFWTRPSKMLRSCLISTYSTYFLSHNTSHRFSSKVEERWSASDQWQVSWLARAQALYNALKIGVEYLSHAIRQPLGLKVIHVRQSPLNPISQKSNSLIRVSKASVGLVATHVHENNPAVLPDTSICVPIRKRAEALMVTEGGKRTPASEFATTLYPKLTKIKPPVS